MRVLFCHNYYQQRGGEDQVFEDEVWLLRDKGHEVREFTLTNHAVDELSKVQLIGKTFWNRAAAHELRLLIAEFRPQVVHCINSFPLLSPAICQVASSMGCAMVQALQNYRLFCPKAQLLRNDVVCEKCIGKKVAWPGVVHGCYRADRFASAVVAGMLSYHRWRGTWLRYVDQFIVPSQITRDKYVQAGFPASSLSLKPNFLRPDPGMRQGGRDYAIFVGRLSAEKGIGTLLEAWKFVSPERKLKILGDGPLAPDVDRACRGNPRIEWLGQRSLQEVCEILGGANFSIVPSVWYEPFGRTVVESFAVGTPVLASAIGAMLELIDDGQSGKFFETGNARDLARQAEEMFECPRTLTDCRIAARQAYLEKFTPDRNYDMLMTIYDKAIQNRRNQNNPLASARSNP